MVAGRGGRAGWLRGERRTGGFFAAWKPADLQGTCGERVPHAGVASDRSWSVGWQDGISVGAAEAVEI